MILKQSIQLSPIRPFSTNTSSIQCITKSYNLTFIDVYIILTNNLLPEQHRRVCDKASVSYAEKIHQTEDTYPIGVWEFSD